MATAEREFSILGQKIVIRDPAEAEIAAAAVKLVNDKLAEIQENKPHLGPQQIAVLALMDIAGSWVKDRQMIDEYRIELDRKCSFLMEEVTKVVRLDRPAV